MNSTTVGFSICATLFVFSTPAVAIQTVMACRVFRKLKLGHIRDSSQGSISIFSTPSPNIEGEESPSGANKVLNEDSDRSNENGIETKSMFSAVRLSSGHPLTLSRTVP